MQEIDLRTSRNRLFHDRRSAGRLLARALERHRDKDVLVLGIPRGGVPVAEEIAVRLGAELDIIVARKLGSPWSPELAIGAVTVNGGCALNERMIEELEIPRDYVKRVTSEKITEARQRERMYRHARPSSEIAGRIVIIVDDGIATGATVIAAARSVRAQHPSKLLVATPVASSAAVHALSGEVDEVVLLAMPEAFRSVGEHYELFDQTSDGEVLEILERMRVPIGAS